MEIATVLGAAAAAVTIIKELLSLMNKVMAMVKKESKVKDEVKIRLFRMGINVGLLRDALRRVEWKMKDIPKTELEGVRNWMDKTATEAEEGQDLMQLLERRYNHYTNRRKKSTLYRMFCIVHGPFSDRRVRELRVMEINIVSLTRNIPIVLRLTDEPFRYEHVYQEIPSGFTCIGFPSRGYEESDDDEEGPAKGLLTGKKKKR